jgi:hypothetical protein
MNLTPLSEGKKLLKSITNEIKKFFCKSKVGLKEDSDEIILWTSLSMSCHILFMFVILSCFFCVIVLNSGGTVKPELTTTSE